MSLCFKLRVLDSPLLSFFCALLLIAALPVARAQSAEPTGITFRVLAWNRNLPDLTYDEAGKPMPLPLSLGRITQPLLHTGGPVLAFYNLTKAANPGQPPPPLVPVVQARLDPALKSVFIVIWLARDGHYVATVLPDDADALKPGQVRFVNISGKELAVNGNHSIKVCPPGNQYVMDAANGGIGLEVAELQAGGGWKLSLRAGVQCGNKQRATVFFFNPSELANPASESGMPPSPQPSLDRFVIIESATVPTARPEPPR